MTRVGRAIVFGLLTIGLFPSSPALGRPLAQPTPEVIAAGFMNAHPDLLFRSRGLARYNAGDYEAARVRFLRAARYADKPSQGMLAEMYWNGEGVQRDRALGYAWMDLAAERQWRPFLTLRERYWAALSPSEQSRALSEGQSLYAVYGDDVAKPRKARVLRRERRDIVGSRTGAVGAVSIEVPGSVGTTVINSKTFFQDQYWDPGRFWAWQDSLWREASRGVVEVGTLQTPKVEAQP